MPAACALPVDGAGPVAESGVRGELKAPVDCCCSRSNISCSSFGRRGGAGLGDHDESTGRTTEKVRAWTRGRRR